jgi:hypothetical protein
VTRATYLFQLARLCNTPPQITDMLGVGDFARLIVGIDDAMTNTG